MEQKDPPSYGIQEALGLQLFNELIFWPSSGREPVHDEAVVGRGRRTDVPIPTRIYVEAAVSALLCYDQA